MLGPSAWLGRSDLWGWLDLSNMLDRSDRLDRLDWTNWPDWFDWSEWRYDVKGRSVFGRVERSDWLLLFECSEWVVRFFVHPTVSIGHVGIDGIRAEHSHTPPTNVRLALWASHMVATSVLFDHDFAFRALPDVGVILSPTVQQLPLCLRLPFYLPLIAAEPVVVFPTGHADGDETGSALENAVPGIGFEGVDFGAVRSGAVPELLGIAIQVVEEGDFQQAFELDGSKESLYDWEGDRKTTLPLVTHARQGELFGVGGGDEEMAKAAVTIRVAAG